jgi:CrcB protein
MSNGEQDGWVRVVWVAVAGAAGALSRYGIGMAVGVRTFPWATLGINLAGSLLLGVVLSRDWPPSTSVPLAVGFLGAFTTFSTFSFETYTMLRTDRLGAAAAYVGASLVGGVLAAAAGTRLP